MITNFNKIMEKNNLSNEELDELVENVKNSMHSLSKNVKIKSEDNVKDFKVTRKSVAPLKTQWGNLYLFYIEVNDKWREYYVIAKCSLDEENFMPKFEKNKPIFMRIDSGCITGIFGDITCDCVDQLQHTIKLMATEKEQGLIITIPLQEGRGKGLLFKLGTMMLQEKLGITTAESFDILSEDGSLDRRSYEGVAGILKFFGINSGSEIEVATNNPEKIQALEENNYIVKRTSIIKIKNEEQRKHLLSKEKYLGHIISETK